MRPFVDREYIDSICHDLADGLERVLTASSAKASTSSGTSGLNRDDLDLLHEASRLLTALTGPRIRKRSAAATSAGLTGDRRTSVSAAAPRRGSPAVWIECRARGPPKHVLPPY